jgi:hypothetical protein
MERLVVRADAYGRHRSKNEQQTISERLGKPVGERTTVKLKRPLRIDRVVRHFKARERIDVIGLFFTDVANRGKGGLVDIDNHGDADPEANERAALGWFRVLAARGFRPLLYDDGNGGFHLRILLADLVPAERVHYYLNDLVADHALYGLADPPEVFPKAPNPAGRGKGLGNWARLPGRHHKRPYWCRVFDGKRWLEGDEAIDFILSLEGHPIDLIPLRGRSTQRALLGGGGRALQCVSHSGNPRTAKTATTTASQQNRLGVYESECLCLPSTTESVGNSDAGIDGCVVRPINWERICALVAKHQPKGERQRHRKLFRLAQAIKALLGDGAPTALLKEIFDLWWEDAQAVVRTKDYNFSFGEFMDAYINCRFAGGLDLANLKAAAKREELPPAAACYTEPMQDLVRVCACLQRLWGERPFYLSTRSAAELVGVASTRTAARFFQVMIRDRLLELIDKGSQETGKASTYRYLPLIGGAG